MTATDGGTTQTGIQDSGIAVSRQQDTQQSASQTIGSQSKKSSKKSGKSTIEPRSHPQRDNRGPPTYLNKVVTHKVDEPGVQTTRQAEDVQGVSAASTTIPKPPVVPGRPFARLHPPTPSFTLADTTFARQLRKSLEQSRTGQKKVKKQKHKKNKKD